MYKRWGGSLGWLEFTVASIPSAGTRRRIVCVEVSGEYWDNATGAEGAGPLSMIVSAALGHPDGPFDALICDFSALSYSGGDGLLKWRDRFGRIAPSLFWCIVSSPANHAKIESLLIDAADASPTDVLFASMASAKEYVCSR